MEYVDTMQADRILLKAMAYQFIRRRQQGRTPENAKNEDETEIT